RTRQVVPGTRRPTAWTAQRAASTLASRRRKAPGKIFVWAWVSFSRGLGPWPDGRGEPNHCQTRRNGTNHIASRISANDAAARSNQPRCCQDNRLHLGTAFLNQARLLQGI